MGSINQYNINNSNLIKIYTDDQIFRNKWNPPCFSAFPVHFIYCFL